ncbi:Txe/YoeB family addiction module toxin [Lactobacillus gigeriorum]|uniref:Txe/YoeB family addiction module toxin n=1 Tax=Lactobacillus gigeriorum TaxID=1203069 RepID=UPI0002E989BE|nr:Txe/YoeB family addiction module toxin [Lactobacillus gigeriorum]
MNSKRKLNVCFVNISFDEYLSWQKTDKKTVKKINELIEDTRRHPFEGKGKPEPLKNVLSGYWSRRINQTDRLVYAVTADSIEIISCKYHY